MTKTASNLCHSSRRWNVDFEALVLWQASAADTDDVVVEGDMSGSSYASAAEDAVDDESVDISQLKARRQQLARQVAEQVSLGVDPFDILNSCFCCVS